MRVRLLLAPEQQAPCHGRHEEHRHRRQKRIRPELEDDRHRQRRDQATAEERLEHQLLVAERLERRGLALRVDDAHEDQARGRHAHRLAEVADAALQPVRRNGARHHPQQQEHVEHDAADAQQHERPDVVRDGLQRNGRQRRHDEQVQRQALDAQHDARVDEVAVADLVQAQLQDDAADHRQREQRHVRQQLHGVGPQHLLDPLDPLQQDHADEDRDGHERHVQRQRLDRRRARRQVARGVLLVLAEQAALLGDRAVLDLGDDLGAAGADGPVDHGDADDDAADQADGGHRDCQVRAFGPAEILEHGDHACGGAVAALESDFDERAGHRGHAEQRRQHGDRQQQADDVLSRRERHADRQLRPGEVVHGLGPGELLPQEQGGEHHRNQQARQRLPHRQHFFAEDAAGFDELADSPADRAAEHAQHLGAQQQGDETAHDRRGQEQLLRHLDPDSHDLADEQHQRQQQQRESNHVRGHSHLLPSCASGSRRRLFRFFGHFRP